MKQFAVYKGDDLLAIGTSKECGLKLGVKPETIKWMTTPTGKKRFESRKNKSKGMTAIRLLEDGAE